MATASIAVRLNAITGEFEKAFSSATRTVSGFEKTFGSAASSIQAHQNRMQQAFAQFSGDRITRDAAALAQAIEKVGGASKLTAAEQRSANATVTEAIEKYRALGQQAPASLIALANATKQAEQPMSTLSKGVGFLQSTFAQFTAANLAANAIQNVVGKVSEFVAQGAKLPGLQASFENLTKSIGEDSASMLRTLQESTRGLVSNLDLMQSANKAILLGLPVTQKEMGELAKAATVLGKAMGQDATKSLDDLITALGRSSPLILDNLGLTVKVGEANEAYAAKLGKTVEQLTDAEKKTAFYQAAMEAARRKVTELGDQTKTLGEISQTVWVSVGNFVTSTIAELNVGIGAQIQALGNLVPKLRDSGAAVEESAKHEKTWRDEIKVTRTELILSSLGLGAYAQNLKLHAEAAKVAELAQSNFNRALANAPKPEQVFKLGEVFDGGVAVRVNKFGTDLLDVSQYLKKYESSLDDAKRAQDAAAKSIRDLRDNLSGAKLRGDVDRLQAAWRGLTTEQRSSLPIMERTADAAQRLADQGALLTPELFQLTLQTGRFQATLPPVQSGLQGIEKAFKDIAPEIRANAKELTDLLGVLNDPKLAGTLGLSGLTLPGERIGKPLIPEVPDRVISQWQLLTDTLDDIARLIPGIGGDFAQFGVQAAQAFARVASGAMTSVQAIQSLQSAGYALLIQLGTQAVTALFEEDRPFTRQMRQDFERQFGGRPQLDITAAMGGVNLNSLDLQTSAAVFERLTGPRLRRELEDTQRALEKYGLTWRDFGIEIRQAQIRLNTSTLFRDFERLTKAGADASKVLTGMSDDLNQLIIDAVRSGTKIPAAMGPILRTLIETKQISEEAAAALLGIADDGVPALADIQAAAERYGLTLDQLGPKVQQLRINEEAKQIVKDFELLTKAGADATVVAGAMVGKIQDILDISWKTGAEVPIALKPIVQILIDMGLLTDQNGNKLENIDDINWGKDLVSAIDLLLDKLADLLDILIDIHDETDAINGARPNLGGNPPTGVAIPRPPPGTTPAPPPDEGGGVAPPGARPSPGGTTFEPQSVQDTSLFTGSLVVPSGGEPTTATFVLEADGRVLGEVTAPYVVGEYQRLGLTP